ncbi:hypothetical protein AAG906_035580 [Vitis piasezkii]
MQDNESLREFMKRFSQAVLGEAYKIDVVCRSSSEASVRAPHFSNHSLKSLLQRWTTYSDVQTNTQCSKMTCEQPPSKDHEEMCLPQGTWSHNRNVQVPPLFGRKAHQGGTFKAIPPLRCQR